MDFDKISCLECSQGLCLVNQFCSKKWKSEVNQHRSFGFYKKNHILFHEGNIISEIYFLYRGYIKIFCPRKNQKDWIIRIAGPGSFLGLAGFYESNQKVNASSFTDAYLCSIQKDFFVNMCKQIPELAVAMIKYYAQALGAFISRQKNYVNLKTEDRIVEGLLYLFTIFHKEFFSSNKPIYIGRGEMADLCCVSPEDVSRVFNSLHNKKLIKYEKKELFIYHPQKLKEMFLASCYKHEIYKNPTQCLDFLN